MIILRSDGTPTYQFANPVDDIDAGITHVLRGEDLLSSTPRQLAVYRALGAPEPLFAHLPMILGPDKKKLSNDTARSRWRSSATSDTWPKRCGTTWP